MKTEKLSQDPMQREVQKLNAVLRDIKREKGEPRLFALLLREESPNRWDLVVSARWVDENERRALKYIAEKVKAALDPDELISLSRIVLLEAGNPVLESITQAIHAPVGSSVRIVNSSFYGIQVKEGYVMVSSKAGPKRPRGSARKKGKE